jgi:hypothetical protein
MVALVLLATTAVGVLTYRNIAAFAQPRALDRIETHAQLLAIATVNLVDNLMDCPLAAPRPTSAPMCPAISSKSTDRTRY